MKLFSKKTENFIEEKSKKKERKDILSSTYLFIT